MLIEIRNLSVKFRVGKEWVEAVKNVSLELEEKMALGIVGDQSFYCGGGRIRKR
jgi:ABC-type glutathione transport system ATPase component